MCFTQKPQQLARVCVCASLNIGDMFFILNIPITLYFLCILLLFHFSSNIIVYRSIWLFQYQYNFSNISNTPILLSVFYIVSLPLCVSICRLLLTTESRHSQSITKMGDVLRLVVISHQKNHGDIICGKYRYDRVS